MSDTDGLSLMEHGVYNLMLDRAYKKEEPLPTNMVELYRLFRAVLPEEQKAVDKVVDKYWILTDNGYINSKSQRLIKEYQSLCYKNKEIATNREANKQRTVDDNRTKRSNKVNETLPKQQRIPESRIQNINKKEKELSTSQAKSNLEHVKKLTQTIGKSNGTSKTQTQPKETFDPEEYAQIEAECDAKDHARRQAKQSDNESAA